MEELVSPQLHYGASSQPQNLDTRRFLFYGIDIFDTWYLGSGLVVWDIYYACLEFIRRLDYHTDSFVRETIFREVQFFERTGKPLQDWLYVVVVKVGVGETKYSVSVIALIKLRENVRKMIFKLFDKIFVNNNIYQMKLL